MIETTTENRCSRGRLPTRGLVGVLGAVVLLASAPAQATVAYVHEIKGRVKYKPHNGHRWGPLPANLLVNAGDQIRLKAGDRARIVYLGKGQRARLVRGPARVTIRGAGRRTAAAARGNTPFGVLLKLLLTRSVSYHRQGQATLASASPNRVDLLSPRFSVVPPASPMVLTWRRKASHRRYRVAVWRYTADFDEKRVTGVVTCRTPVCRFTVPTGFTVVPGRRHYWNVRILGTGLKPYPVDGVWFVPAAAPTLRALHDDLARAKAAPAASRSLAQALAWAKHGFHQRALRLLPAAPRGHARALKAQLLCITCRSRAANRLAGKRTFCRCKEEPDR